MYISFICMANSSHFVAYKYNYYEGGGVGPWILVQMMYAEFTVKLIVWQTTNDTILRKGNKGKGKDPW